MRHASLLLVALLGACTFPDVLTGDPLDASSTGDPSGPGPGGTTDVAGPGPTSTGSAGGGGNASSTADASTTTSAQGGAGGTGDGGAGTTGSTGGAPGTGGEGGGGDGGNGPSTTTSATATTTTGSGGSGPCPTNCDACRDSCPEDATVGDCDGDGDPDATDCQRCDARVFAGQPGYFTTAYPRLQGGTSFDYDCSGSASTDYNEGECAGLVCPAGDRFYSEPPACGQPATSVSCRAVALVGCMTDQTFNDPVGCH